MIFSPWATEGFLKLKPDSELSIAHIMELESLHKKIVTLSVKV